MIQPAKKVGKSAFGTAFAKGPVLLNTLVCLFLVYSFLNGHSIARDMKLDNPELLYYTLPSISEAYYYGLIFIQTTATALMMFVFTANKRVSVTYFSLPVSRADMFWARYTAGLVLIFVPHIIYFACMLYSNIALLGFSAVIMSGFAIMSGTAFVTLFFMYSAVVAISLCVGTLTEKLVFSWVIVFGINLFMMGIIKIFMMFLPGSSVGEVYAGRKLPSEIIGIIQSYIPPNGSLLIFNRYNKAFGSAEDFHVSMWGDELSGGLGTVAVWGVITLVISLLALAAFKRYKAEHAGVQGVNSRLRNAMVVVAAFSSLHITTTGINEVTKYHIIIKILIYLFIVFILSSLLLTRSAKQTFSRYGMRIYGCIAAMFCVTAVCSLAGGFGYSAYQPDIGDIMAAEITYTGAPDFIPGEGNYSVNFFSGVVSRSTKGDICVRDYTDLKFVSENDLRIVLELHKELIDAGPSVFLGKKQRVTNLDKDWLRLSVHVKYYLKNGKTVDRLYRDVPVRTAINMLKLEETDEIRKRTGDTTAFAATLAKGDGLPIYITDSLFGSSYMLERDYQVQFLEVLQKDIDNLSINEKYYSDKAAKAVVCFPRLVSEGSTVGRPEYTFIYEEMNRVYVALQTGVNENMDFTKPPGKEIYIPESERAVVEVPMGINGENVRRVSFKNANYEQYMNTVQIYITDSYVNTLAFLRENGLCGFIDITAGTSENIIEIRAQRYLIIPPGITQELYFRSSVTSEKIISNSAKIPLGKYPEIMRLARTHYYAAEGGYRVYVDMINPIGERQQVMLFLPEDDAPEYVKQAFE